MFGKDISNSASNEANVQIDNRFFTIDNHKDPELESSLIDSDSLGMGISSSLSAIRIYQPSKPRVESPWHISKDEIYYEDISKIKK